MKFSIKDFFRKCDQIRMKLWIWSHLLNKSFMENFIFCAVYFVVVRKELGFCLTALPWKNSLFTEWFCRSANNYENIHRLVSGLFLRENRFQSLYFKSKLSPFP